MRITVSGIPGSGKSTVAKFLAQHFKLKHYSTGDFMRGLAEKRKISLLELSRKAEKDFSIDKEIDDMTRSLRGKDNFVMDSRLAFHFLPDSIKIFLTASLKKAAGRIFREDRGIEKENLSLDKTLQNIRRRIKSEGLRYSKYYGIRIYDKKNYDIVIDTSDLSIGEMNQTVLARLNKFIQPQFS